MPGQAPPVPTAGEKTQRTPEQIRQVLSRLTDPAVVAELRRLAEREAGLAESAGDDQLADYWRTVAGEATTAIQVRQCLDQPVGHTRHAHPYRF